MTFSTFNRIQIATTASSVPTNITNQRGYALRSMKKVRVNSARSTLNTKPVVRSHSKKNHLPRVRCDALLPACIPNHNSLPG